VCVCWVIGSCMKLCGSCFAFGYAENERI
jgi:hypothetical protein